MLCGNFRFGEAQQQIAVMRVLLLPQLDLARQTLADGVGEGVELVENGDDADLLGEGWDGNLKVSKFARSDYRHSATLVRVDLTPNL